MLLFIIIFIDYSLIYIMPDQTTKPQNNKPKQQMHNTAIIIILLIALIALAVLYMQKSTLSAGNSQAYANLNSSYMKLESQLSELQSQFQSNANLLTNVTNKYAAVEHNVTTPYTETIYRDYSTKISAQTSAFFWNATKDQEILEYKEGQYNFTFNAPYPGYLIFNETNTGTSDIFLK